ncbi:S1C family serine protease [Aquisalibacillus elongatus]|uniref:Serine protease Do n=1 Tax=Aquisalibacillus elongatus TaxID=485577 RepID=A0A3N5AZF1_9BACI|nr:trypsin-like peptidase domain-containing protein [Aquisalibacillus elongatus]RPF50333.1 serine protease Do [Aquisalibacillus elongatus]
MDEEQKLEQQETTHQDTHKSSESKGIGKLFMAGIVGGAVATIMTAFLLSTNILTSANESENSEQPDEESQEQAEISDNVFDSENISTDLNELAKSIVGVVNIQQQNIFDQGSETGTGSGIIYKKDAGDAYVVTNQHVIDGAEQVEVALNQDERVDAEIVGKDQLTDLAVLKIDGNKVSNVAKLGSSEDTIVGDTVVAIGNPLGLEFSNSITKGIISGKNRSLSVDTNGDRQPDWVTDVIQTDAAINPGNSGGALVNEKGEVIGINSMKIAQQRVEGMGFAIPIDQAQKVIQEIEEHGEVKRPLVGISAVGINQVPQPYNQNIQLPSDVSEGLVVAQVQDGSPAAEAGLQQYDVITKINDHEIKNTIDLKTYLYNQVKINDEVELTFYRNGEEQTVTLTLDKAI